jgi:U3 small nucleolar RNA-associated protein 21
VPASQTVAGSEAEDLEKERTRVLALSRQGMRSEFTRLLQTGDLEEFVEHLKGLSPAAADVEIRSLSHGGDSADGAG